MAKSKEEVPIKREEKGLRPWLGWMDDDFERMLQRPFSIFGGPWRLPRLLRAQLGEVTWAPRLDSYFENGDLVVSAELPGLKKDEVEVSIIGDNLVLQGEHEEEEEVKEDDYYRCERAHGAFYRSLPIPFEADPKKIKAKFSDGVLEVRVPVPAEFAVTSWPHRGSSRPAGATTCRRGAFTPTGGDGSKAGAASASLFPLEMLATVAASTRQPEPGYLASRIEQGERAAT